MNWMTLAWPMVMGACVTLALLNLRIAFGDGRRAPHVFFFLSALAVAGISGMELELLQEDVLERYQTVLRWASVPIAIMVASMSGFVWTFFRTGRLWLAIAGVVLLVASQVANLVSTVPAVRHAVAIRQVDILGHVRFTLADIVNGPWAIVEMVGLVLVVAFVLDASVSLWIQGGRRRAAVVGGSVVFFLLASRGHAFLVENAIVHTPYFVSFSFLMVVLAMGYELGDDVLRAARLARDLQTSEQRLKLAGAAARLALWEWDIRADRIWVSEEGGLHYGVAPQEPMDFERFSAMLHPDDRAAVQRSLNTAIAGSETFAAEYRVMLPDGTVRWIAAGGRVERATTGSPLLLRGVSIDVTERKQTELEMAQQRYELAHLSRVGILGELSGSLAHELNQPLAAMLSNAQVGSLCARAQEPDLPEVAAIFDDIAADAKRAGGIIHGMRAMFRKSLRTQLESVDVNEAITDTLTLLHGEIVGRRARVEQRLSDALPTVNASRVELQQVLMNLMLNSLDALNPADESPHLEIVSMQEGPGVVVSVRDHGSGIHADFLDRLFEPFATNKPSGLGLGLAICRRIMDGFGGEISAGNHPEGGAVFSLRLVAFDGQKAARQ